MSSAAANSPHASGFPPEINAPYRDMEAFARKQKLLLIALYLPLFASTLLAKISVPPLGAMGFSLSIPLTLLVTGIGVCCGLFVVKAERFFIYACLITWACLTQVFRDLPFSLSSILYMVVFFAPFVFQLANTPHSNKFLLPEQAYYVFGQLATALAILGALQYGAQFIIGASLSFPIEFWLPKSFSVLGYNNLIPLSYGASVFKANGIVMLEPSTFSQFTALGLLFELSFWARKSRLFIYITALALTYSGTGIVILMVGLASLIIFKRRWDIIFIILGAVAVLAVFAEPLHLDVFVKRATEIQSTGSSGFARFGAWIYVFKEHWIVDPLRVLTGLGAGSFGKYSLDSQFVAAEMGFSKIFFEFGLVGGVIYFYFLIRLIFSCGLPIACSLGLCTMLLLNGAYSPTVMGIFLTVLLWPMRPGRVSSNL